MGRSDNAPSGRFGYKPGHAVPLGFPFQLAVMETMDGMIKAALGNYKLKTAEAPPAWVTNCMEDSHLCPRQLDE